MQLDNLQLIYVSFEWVLVSMLKKLSADWVPLHCGDLWCDIYLVLKIHIHVLVCTYLCSEIVCTYICEYTLLHSYLHTYTHACVHVYTPIYMCIHAYLFTCSHTHTQLFKNYCKYDIFKYFSL